MENPVAEAWWNEPSVAINVLMLPLAAWAVSIYIVVMIVVLGSSGRVLGKLERRFREETPEPSSDSHRPWPRFRAANLPLAVAAARLQRRLTRWVWTFAVLATLGDLYFTFYLLSLARNVGAAPFAASAFILASCLPLLATLRFARWLWRTRASTEWQVAKHGADFEQALLNRLSQDVVKSRSASLESILMRRFRSAPFARRPVAEQRIWLARLQPAIGLRAAMAVPAYDSRSDWRGWGARWLDEVARAFEPRIDESEVRGLDQLVVPDHRTTDDVGLRTANWVVLSLGFLGMGLLLLGDHPVGLGQLWSSWDTALGRVSAVIAISGGVLTLFGINRSGSRSP